MELARGQALALALALVLAVQLLGRQGWEVMGHHLLEDLQG